MLAVSVHRLLWSRREGRLAWRLLSLAVALAYAAPAVVEAFSSPYVIQDDAIQYVPWMWRFTDPTLFSEDVIADYFQATTPDGYAALFLAAATLGIDPVTFSKVLPLIVALAVTALTFELSQVLLPRPFVAFVCAVVMNLLVWTRDDVSSGTPRAFFLPIFLAFLYCLARGNVYGCLATIVLAGLFYPTALLIAVGVVMVGLLRKEGRAIRLTRSRRAYALAAATVAGGLLSILPFAAESDRFGPVVSEAEARRMPEFQENGRNQFFLENRAHFWLGSARAGYLPVPRRSPFLWLSLALPLLLVARRRPPLLTHLSPSGRLLLDVLVASSILYALAHVLLFRLYYPSRYSDHSLRIVVAIAGSLTICAALHIITRWAARAARPGRGWTPLAGLGLAGVLLITIVFSPLWLRLGGERFPAAKYARAGEPALYHFFADQPKAIRIASLAEEADYLPAFSRRSILVGQDYALALHTGYYSEMRRRAKALIAAQYTEDAGVLRQTIEYFGIDFWLVDRDAFSARYLRSDRWIVQFQPEADEAIWRLRRGGRPVMRQLADECAAFRSDRHAVLTGECMLRRLS